MVVLFHADPVLFDFSSPLYGSTPAWTMVVFVDCLCHRILRTLRIACALAAKRLVGGGRVRHISSARVRALDVTGHVAHAIDSSRSMVFASRPRVTSRTNPLSGCVATLPWALRIHLRRFRHWHMLHARDRWHRRNHFVVQRAG